MTYSNIANIKITGWSENNIYPALIGDNALQLHFNNVPRVANTSSD